MFAFYGPTALRITYKLLLHVQIKIERTQLRNKTSIHFLFNPNSIVDGNVYCLFWGTTLISARFFIPTQTKLLGYFLCKVSNRPYKNTHFHVIDQPKFFLEVFQKASYYVLHHMNAFYSKYHILIVKIVSALNSIWFAKSSIKAPHMFVSVLSLIWPSYRTLVLLVITFLLSLFRNTMDHFKTAESQLDGSLFSSFEVSSSFFHFLSLFEKEATNVYYFTQSKENGPMWPWGISILILDCRHLIIDR